MASMASTFKAEFKEWAFGNYGRPPRCPWQNPYAERVIGSIRRECLSHVIVLHDKHLRRILKSYFRYYHESRTHLSLDKDAPEAREIQANKLERIVQIRQVGGLHHRYQRAV
jgi:putative transposase